MIEPLGFTIDFLLVVFIGVQALRRKGLIP